MDLGAQEEFGDNFWCFEKFRCSTLHFSTSGIYFFGFGGSVRPKPSLASPKLAQNRSKRAQKAKPSFYRWFAVSGWPTGHTHRYFLPLDSIGTFRDGESGCDKCVTKVWQIFVTHLSHMCRIGFRASWGEKLQKQNCTIEIDTMLTQRAVWIWFWLLWDRIPLQNVWQTFVTVCHKFVTPNLVHSEVGK